MRSNAFSSRITARTNMTIAMISRIARRPRRMASPLSRGRAASAANHSFVVWSTMAVSLAKLWTERIPPHGRCPRAVGLAGNHDLAVPGQKIESELAGGALLDHELPCHGGAFLSLNLFVRRLPAACAGARDARSDPLSEHPIVGMHGSTRAAARQRHRCGARYRRRRRSVAVTSDGLPDEPCDYADSGFQGVASWK